MPERPLLIPSLEKPRILIVGPIASGKSRAARMLGDYTALSVVHIDHIMMDRARNAPKPKEEFLEDVTTRLAQDDLQDGWIIDGNYGSIKHLTWEKADIIGYIRPSYPRNLFQAAHRGIMQDTTSGNSKSGPFTQITRVIKTRAEELEKCDERVITYSENGASLVVEPTSSKLAHGLMHLL